MCSVSKFFDYIFLNPRKVLMIFVKIWVAGLCLYCFICSLELLATSFRLLSGKQAGGLISQTDFLSNPIVGVMLGILVTALIQSSSTTTSVIVGLVAGDILNVRQCIPMIMGANIGTSVTNTIVATTMMSDRDNFRLAFAAATVQDIFNWITVLVLLPLECFSGYLFELTKAIVNSMHISKQDHPPDVLGPILKPFTELIVQIDKEVLELWSKGLTNNTGNTLLKSNCERFVDVNITSGLGNFTDIESTQEIERYQCGYLFARSGFTDTWTGLNLLVISMVMLIVCLVSLVKVLKSMVQDKLADHIKNAINAVFPYVPWLTGYFAMLIGAIITFLVQSSSVFTSTLTPVVGAGVISIERAYELTLGSNIGTTTTGILAALATDSDHLRDALQIALCHLFFNISGILLFYPIPFMRWPIPISIALGNTVGKYRWFALVYMLVLFFVAPLLIFGLSMAGPEALYVGVIPVIIGSILIVLINVVQKKKPELLPNFLRNWEFLPEWMRSLDPIDRLLPNVDLGRRGFGKKPTKTILFS